MPDPIFAHPRLAEIYDALDSDRGDLDHYVAIVEELGARSILDVGCGTGTFACHLAAMGLDVAGVDPAEASLEVARGKLSGDRVRWTLGDAAALPPLEVDLATMTGNVAQVFVSDADWMAALGAVRGAIRDSGHLVFEVRDPTVRDWETWTPERARARTTIPGVGVVESWVEITDVSLPRVSFRSTYRFASDDAVLTSDSTLRFRERGEIEASLAASGFVVQEVRGAPDRPGKEFVFIARADAAPSPPATTR